MKIIYVIAGVLAVLAVVAIGAVVFLNMSPSTATQQTNTPRVRNTAVAGDNNNASAQDPLDDSTEDTLPNVPITEVSGDEESNQDPLDDSAPNTNNPNIPPAASPPSNEGMVSLPGTAWVQQESNEVYEFCSDTIWQISDDNDTVTGTGTFVQTPTTLVMSGDGDPKTYDATWDPAARLLVLKQGETTLNLIHNGESDCP